MRQKCNENAANRYSYVGDVYRTGEVQRKKETLDAMPKEWSDLHRKGYIHIHDLDAHGLTYNCLTFNIRKDFPYDDFKDPENIEETIVGYFSYLERLFTDMGNEQSGGMALANFDVDTAYILDRLGVPYCEAAMNIISACVRSLIVWCNHTHTRMGTTSYYVSLNIGLADTPFARHIDIVLLDQFLKLGDTVFKPNIVFKVVGGVNRFPDDPNYDLFTKALLCSAKKMIPTYLLCDSKPNQGVDPTKIAIMGCRTRVVADLYGEDTSIGRGNIDNISINLPRLALEVERDHSEADAEQKMRFFKERWDEVARITKDILLDRFQKTCARTREDFPTNAAHHLWVEDFDDIPSVFHHGTLSLGFIGLSEAMEVLTGKRFYADPDTVGSGGHLLLVKEDGVYLSAGLVANYTDIRSVYFENSPVHGDEDGQMGPRRIFIDSTWGEEQRAETRFGGAVRRRGGVKSPVITEVSRGTGVTILNELDNWSYVRTDTGFMGYMHNNAQLQDFMQKINTLPYVIELSVPLEIQEDRASHTLKVSLYLDIFQSHYKPHALILQENLAYKKQQNP